MQRQFLVSYSYFFIIFAFVTALISSIRSFAWADEGPAAIDAASQQQASEAEQFREETQFDDQLEPTESPAAPSGPTDTTSSTAGEGPSFVLTSVIFEGNTVFSTAELEKFAAPLLGQTVRLSNLKEIARQITLLYRSKGYLTSRAYIGPQEIADGVVTIKLLEGRLDRTVVEGNRYFSTGLIEEMAVLPSDGPFQYTQLEKRLRFVNRNPDMDLSAVLTPGDRPETSNLNLKTDDKFPIHGYYEFNNHGTKFTHRSRHTVTGIHNNFLGRADMLSVTGSIAEEDAFEALSASWALPYWPTGTTFLLSGSYVDSLLVKHLEPLDIKGKFWNVTPAVSQELVATATDQVSWYTGFEIKDSKSTVGDFKSSLDRMRVLVTGPRWSHLDKGGRTSLSADVHWGVSDFLGGLEAEDGNASRAGSGGDFVYYTGSASRVQRLFWNLLGVLRVEGQWSDGPLTSVEAMRIGGYSSVRGYPESDSIGDYGFSGSAELLIPVPAGDDWRVPFTDERVSKAIQGVLFFDGGKVFSHDRVNATDRKDRMLLGAGVGVRVNLKNNLSAQFDYGWPLGDDSTDQIDQPQAHFSVRAGL